MDDADPYGYGEDVHVADIGLTWVASKWSIPEALLPEDIEHYIPGGSPSAFWSGVAEVAVDDFDRSKARQLGQDIRRLVESPVPDEAIHTVWLGATHGVLDPAGDGLDARSFLLQLEEAWLARVRREDAAYPPPPPEPVVDEEVCRAVLGVLQPVADDLDRAVRATSYGVVPTGLVPALEQVVTDACADLGYRLFLGAMKAYFVEIDQRSHDAFRALGERFGYPEFLVGDNLNHQG
ncbi:hypothetical protein [Streptomyces sp. enrichment culture]|uniref:hypothetical protein n=1 Tax=Streptomyces sp. enrichment culture TaxID=1795815 RepID=UPI003F5585D5